MQVGLVYQKLKEFFPNQVQNMQFPEMNLRDASSLDAMFRNKLPHLPLHKVHALCREQEKNIMKEVVHIKQMDLYDEMSQVCPHDDFKNLRSLSHEEVNLKLQKYTSQMTTCSEKEMENETDPTSSEMADFSQDIELGHIESQIDTRNNRGLGNIFEEYDHHLSWNELGIYDLH